MPPSVASSANSTALDFATLLDRANTHWQRAVSEGSLTTEDGIKIRYARLDVENPRALLVLSNGRSESYLKYVDTAYQLNQHGYSVLLYDHRGQGFSDRLLSDPKKGYVSSFNDYVEDLKQLIESQVDRKVPLPVVLLSHSMGGTVSVLYAQKYPHDLDALILSSPMLGLPAGRTGSLLAGVIDSVENLLFDWFKKEPGYIPGIGQYSDVPFEKNGLTHSRERYRNMGALVRKHPEIALGDPTTHWVRESFLAFDRVFANTEKISTPFLLLQAGGDSVVSNDAQDLFCRQTAGHCFNGSALTIDKARHELLNESDEFRTPALDEILAFLDHISDRR